MMWEAGTAFAIGLVIYIAVLRLIRFVVENRGSF